MQDLAKISSKMALKEPTASDRPATASTDATDRDPLGGTSGASASTVGDASPPYGSNGGESSQSHRACEHLPRTQVRPSRLGSPPLARRRPTIRGRPRPSSIRARRASAVRRGRKWEQSCSPSRRRRSTRPRSAAADPARAALRPRSCCTALVVVLL